MGIEIWREFMKKYKTKHKAQIHPIYLNGYVDGFGQLIGMGAKERAEVLNDVFENSIVGSDRNKEMIENQGEAFARMRFYSELEQKLEIIDSGHQLVKINSDDWNESISKKSLGKMLGDEVRLPYDAFAIDISGAEWAGQYETAFVSKYNGQLVIRLEDGKDNWYLILLALDLTIDDTLANTVYLPMSEDITFKVLSIIMYMTLFKREKNRVDIRTVKARNTVGVPKYRVSQIRLIQPEYALLGKHKHNASKDGVQLHIRRGHFRDQPYGKREDKLTRPVFIKPQWVGKGRAELMRGVTKETII